MSQKRTQHNITAFIYDKRGRILSMGKNSYVKTHPLQAKYARHCGDEHKDFLHAEIHAISRCNDISKAHRILVMRYNNQGMPMLAKPCKICQHAISLTPIKIIDHT
jgi:tRNA(Arg) A34 adenosine deaminase TadA